MKKEGFILLENIISVFILLMIVYIVSSSLNHNFKLLNKNQEYIEMLNIAQNKMNEAKSRVKYDENFDEEVLNIALDKYTVKTVITKNQEYYNNYKIDLEVKSNERSINLKSYATKK